MPLKFKRIQIPLKQKRKKMENFICQKIHSEIQKLVQKKITSEDFKIFLDNFSFEASRSYNHKIIGIYKILKLI